MPSDTNLKQISSISAVFPAYNDAGTIPSMVLIALMALREVTDDFEVIVTNDGSRDDTGKVLDELARRYPELKVIHHPVNQGYGCALRTGFANASKNWIFYTDGDGQYDPKELINLTQALTDGIDVVNGFKITRHDPLIRVIIGRIYHHIVKIAFGFKLKDVDCDFRLIRRDIFDKVELESRTGTICLEMVKKFQDAGYHFAEVPVNHFYRAYGKSQFFRWKHLWTTFRHLSQLWWKLVVKKEHMRDLPGENPTNEKEKADASNS